MTTAISISDTVFETAEQFAQKNGISRNEFYEMALNQYLNTRQEFTDAEIRAQFNAVYDREPSGLDPLFVEIQARSLPENDQIMARQATPRTKLLP